MGSTVSSTDFQARTDLTDWRYLFQRIDTMFRASSFTAAGALAQAIAAEADAADHHPDIDVRYPDRVHVVLSTHSEGGVTEKDLALAAVISRLAADAGATTEPLVNEVVEVAIDAMDIDAVRPFWKAVLAYTEVKPTDGSEQVRALRDPAGIGPPFWFQQMDEPRTERNRFHIDVTVPVDVAPDRIAAALAAGGHLVTDEFAKAWWVLADAEGNEACICTCEDRD